MNYIGKPMFQGDVGLIAIDAIPKDAQPVEATKGEYIVTHSETGHNHVIAERPEVRMYQDPSDPLKAYLEIVAIDVMLEHQRSFDTHAPITLSPGKYAVHRQREWTAEGFRRAQD